MGVGDGEAHFGEGGHAICVAELADTDEAVGEAWYNVAHTCVHGGQGVKWWQRCAAHRRWCGWRYGEHWD